MISFKKIRIKTIIWIVAASPVFAGTQSRAQTTGDSSGSAVTRFLCTKNGVSVYLCKRENMEQKNSASGAIPVEQSAALIFTNTTPVVIAMEWSIDNKEGKVSCAGNTLILAAEKTTSTAITDEVLNALNENGSNVDIYVKHNK
jgi:hypothetical protein